MGLKDYLRRTIRPWLSHDPRLELGFKGGKIRLHAPVLELDVDALNAFFMASSAVLFEQCCIEGITFTVSPFTSPAATLQAEDLRVILRPRPAEDGFWKAGTECTVKQEREEKIAALDPQGAEAHVQAEHLARGDAMDGFVPTLVKSVLLHALQIQLQHASVMLLSNPVNSQAHCYSLQMQKMNVEGGFLNGSKSIPGLFGAMIAGMISTMRKPAGSSFKVLRIYSLDVHLKTKFLERESGAGASNMHSTLKESEECEGRSALLLKEVVLSGKFKGVRANGTDILIPESIVELDCRKIEALLLISHQLNGMATVHEICQPEAYSDQQRQMPKRDAKHLWIIAVEKILGTSEKKNLKFGLHSVMWRHKYMQLYESWLRLIGWGLDDTRQIGKRKRESRRRLISDSRLVEELASAEQEISIEAIVVARRVARNRALAPSKDLSVLHSETTLERRSAMVFNALGRLWGFVLVVFCALLKPLLLLKLKRQKHSHHEMNPSDAEKASSASQNSFPHHDTEVFEKRAAEAWDFNSKSALGFAIYVQRGSLTLMGLPSSSGVVNTGKAKGTSEMSRIEILPSVRMCWERFYLAYYVDTNQYGVELICADVQGQLFSLISERTGEGFSRDGYEKISKEVDTVVFLFSCPASHVPPLGLKDNQGSSYGKQKTLTMPRFRSSILQMPFSSVLCEDVYMRPFLWVDLENLEADFRVGGRNCDIVKCELSMGQLDLKLDDLLFLRMAPLVWQVKEALTFGSVRSQNNLENSRNQLHKFQLLEFNDLLISLGGFVQEHIDKLIPRKKLQIISAVDSPKLQLTMSGLKRNLEDVNEPNKKLAGSIREDFLEEGIFVVHLGFLKLIITPHYPKIEDVLPKQMEDALIEKNTTAKKLSTPLFSEDGFDIYLNHTEVENVVSLSVKDAIFFSQWSSDSQEVHPLLGPVSITLESFLCRGESLSLFSSSHATSAVVDVTVSNCAIHLCLDEMEALFKTIGLCMKALDTGGDFFHSSTESGHGFLLRADHQREAEVMEYHTISCQICSLLAISCQISFEGIQLILDDRRGNGAEQGIRQIEPATWKQRITEGIVLGERVMPENGELAYTWAVQKSVCVMMQSLCWNLSWGERTDLIMDTQVEAVKICLLDCGAFAASENIEVETRPPVVPFMDTRLPRLSKLDKGTDVNSKATDGFHISNLKLKMNGPSLFQLEEILNDVEGQRLSSIEEEEAALSMPGQALNMQFTQATNMEICSESDIIIEQKQNSWLSAKLEVEIFRVLSPACGNLMKEAVSSLSDSKFLQLSVDVHQGFRQVAIELKGGCIFLHIPSLSVLLQSIQIYISLLTVVFSSTTSSGVGESKPLLTKTRKRDGHDTVTSSLMRFEKSPSLPLEDRRVTFHHRVLSAPRVMQQIESGGSQTALRYFVDGLTLDVSNFVLVLAETDAMSPDSTAGLLFELDMVSSVNASASEHIASFHLKRLFICSLQTQMLNEWFAKEEGKKYSHFPHFGSIALGSSRGAEHDTSLSGGSDTGNAASTSSSSIDSTEGEASGKVSNCIMEKLEIRCDIKKTLLQGGLSLQDWENCWRGNFCCEGLNITVTTLEVKLMLAIITSLSELSIGDRHQSVKQSIATARKLESVSKLEIEIPDGAIIAIKDVKEHSYLAVDKVNEQYRLVGVLHHSLVGERALFQVKYQNAHVRNAKEAWFSLLSLYAKSSNGEPLRVHFRSGSGSAEIMSTNDNSWELWRVVSPNKLLKDEAEELNVYGDLHSSLLYLVNQKSKCGLALTSGVPLIVKHPGNPFKFKVFKDPNSYSCIIPKIELKLADLSLTVLHQAGGGMQLLPLVRLCFQESQAVMQPGTHKIRIMGQGRMAIDYFQSHSSLWIALMSPIEYDYFYRNGKFSGGELHNEPAKTPFSLFARFKKIDIIISESSLDMCLFLIGAMNLAGPFTLRHSPVLANCCQVKNGTGVNLLCKLDDNKTTKSVRISSWQTNSFLVRHLSSRKESRPEKLSSSVELQLEKAGSGSSLPIKISFSEPGCMAIRARLTSEQGGKVSAGPIVVADISKRNQEGIIVRVSPMVNIQNCSGLLLELRCRRKELGDGEGVTFVLNDGDRIDDTMAAFNALNLKGQQRKALLSFNLGNFLLAVRPSDLSASVLGYKLNAGPGCLSFDWSEDLEGVKAVPVSNFFEKLQFKLKQTLQGRTLESTFGIVHCELKTEGFGYSDSIPLPQSLYFLVRTVRRKVPMRGSQNQQDSKQKIVAWQEQQELVLLPTIRVYNFLTANIKVILTSGKAKEPEALENTATEFSVSNGSSICMYTELNELHITVIHDDLKLRSKTINISDWGRSSRRKGSPSDNIKRFEMEIDFEDSIHYAQLKVFRGEDGVLQVIVYTQYLFQNDSDTPLFCCGLKRTSFWRGRSLWSEGQPVDWPSAEIGLRLNADSKVSWLERSHKLLLRRTEKDNFAVGVDLESISGNTELNISYLDEGDAVKHVQIGLSLKAPLAEDIDPTIAVCILPRYILVNDSPESIYVCQDGLEVDDSAKILLNPGQRVSMNSQNLTGHGESSMKHLLQKGSGVVQNTKSDTLFSVRFGFKDDGWRWSGPVCFGGMGSFFLRMKRSLEAVEPSQSIGVKESFSNIRFASLNVEEKRPSFIMRFSLQPGHMAPYRIENALRKHAIQFNQKGLTESEVLKPGCSFNYAWDDLSLPHKLIVQISGTKICREIHVDKLRTWKSLRVLRRNNAIGLQLPFQSQLEAIGYYENDGSSASDSNVDALNVGYEVCADGPHRVLRICEDVDSRNDNWWSSQLSLWKSKIDFKVPLFKLTLVELVEQDDEKLQEQTAIDNVLSSPFVSLSIGNLMVEVLVTENDTLFQMKAQTLNVDELWKGAPFAHMLRVHSEDRFVKDQTVLHMAVVISNHASNPNQVKYSSILLQAIDLNLDEDTLMKLVPFYRYSLAESTYSRQIYFDRFEIHPIKILASFLPGLPHADYSSAQETLRALLHSVIKIPSIKGTMVELNGVLLSNALLTFRQLATKCAQHYSWYAMRAVYIAKGSKLLPPAFASLFDDSAASSLDVFFDPSIGSIDLQGLTLGMFNLLSKGLRRREFGGTSRYIGDLERAMKNAGSNILFAVLTEVSDNVLKGAETGGFDGMVSGFRRGLLNVAMEPSLLRSAVVKGGSSRRIKLDRSAGMDEMYIEGYLQAMLDALFKQDYLRVKVVDDLVLLKNLPPNSVLIEEIIGCVKNFVIGEGLLAGETSVAAIHSLRRLKGENEKRIGPTVINLCEQLVVIFVVRILRNKTKEWVCLGMNRWAGDSISPHEEAVSKSQVKIEDESHEEVVKGEGGEEKEKEKQWSIKRTVGSFVISSAMAYIDGRLCRHIPNPLARRIVSAFLLSFVE